MPGLKITIQHARTEPVKFWPTMFAKCPQDWFVTTEPRITLPVETNWNDLGALKRTASRMLSARGGMLYVKDESGEPLEIVEYVDAREVEVDAPAGRFLPRSLNPSFVEW